MFETITSQLNTVIAIATVNIGLYIVFSMIQNFILRSRLRRTESELDGAIYAQRNAERKLDEARLEYRLSLIANGIEPNDPKLQALKARARFTELLDEAQVSIREIRDDIRKTTESAERIIAKQTAHDEVVTLPVMGAKGIQVKNGLDRG